MQKGNLQHQYDLWSQAIIQEAYKETIKKVEKVIKKRASGKV